MTGGLRLVLASASPRRRELVELLGVPVLCVAAEIDEGRHDGESPVSHVLRVARAKAAAVSGAYPDDPIIAADTSVVLGDRILGKPRDRAEALAMLTSLSGRAHVVLTGVCAAFRGRSCANVESATVTFRELTPELARWYLATGEGDDKAGAYAVQGAGGVLVSRVDGNVQTVIGLPLSPMLDLLARVGVTAVAEGAAMQLRSVSPRT